jgi:HD-like signal output (HDOD) protein
MSDTVDTKKSLADRIIEVVESDRIQLPPLPELAVRVREMLADEERADARRIAELMRSDPAVVASLLRISNSAAFGGLAPISDLGQAIARLGLKQVGSIVTGLVVKGHFASDAPDKSGMLRKLWDHAVVSGFASRHLGQRVGVEVSEAFLAGLLHDIGSLLVLKAVDHLEGVGLEFAPTRAVIDELMDLLHTRLGHHALTSWKLPETICNVALHHENPCGDGDDPLLTCVQASDLICQKLGFHLRPDPGMVLFHQPAMELLGLGDVELATLMVDLEDELDDVRKLF